MSREDDNKQSQTDNARRTILKSLAAGGGIAATGKSLPASWSDPVVNSVLLPAHAATSASSGVFSGTADIASLRPRDISTKRELIAQSQGVRRKVLDFLVPPTYASHIGSSFCDTTPVFTFEILEGSDPRTVRVCITFNILDDDGGGLEIPNAMFPTSTTINGNSIANAQRTLNDDEVVIHLTNMQLSSDGNTITGNYSSSNTDDDDQVCPGSFTATRTAATFSCPATVTD